MNAPIRVLFVMLPGSLALDWAGPAEARAEPESGRLIPMVSVFPEPLPPQAAASSATAARATKPFLLKTFMRSSFITSPSA